jgi:hypothetical protein
MRTTTAVNSDLVALSRMKWIIYARKRDVIGEDINDELLGTL